MNKKLKNCPLCDSSDVTVEDQTEYIGTPIPYEQVICESCGCQTGIMLEAIAAWNTRRPNKELVEALEGVMPYVNNKRPMCNAECLGGCGACQAKKRARKALAHHKKGNVKNL